MSKNFRSSIAFVRAVEVEVYDRSCKKPGWSAWYSGQNRKDDAGGARVLLMDGREMSRFLVTKTRVYMRIRSIH